MQGASSSLHLPTNQQSQGHLLTGSHSHHLSPSTTTCLAYAEAPPCPLLLLVPLQSLPFTTARAMLSKPSQILSPPQNPPLLESCSR